MKRLALIAALSAIAAPAMAQSSLFPPYGGQYNRHNDPMQWTLEEMAQHQSHVTMPDGKSMTCTSTPDPILKTTEVHCN